MNRTANQTMRDSSHRGFNKGLAGCGMGHKIEAGCKIREISRAGNGMKISWRDRDALISIGGMRDSFQIDSGMQDLHSKRPFEKLTSGIGIESSESDGMAG